MRQEPDTVFLVEDDPASRRLVRAILEPKGYRITEAAAFGEAQEILSDVVPGLVLLDLRLPGGSGLELLRHIRAQHPFDGVPVVAITAQAMKEDEKRCRDAGFDHFLPKPVDTRQLRAVVDEVISRGRAHAR